MGVIPKKTTPLTKFIRTGEGVLVFAFNLTMLIVPIVSNSLSPEDAVKWAGIVNGVAVICRTGLKVVAEVSKTTGIEPQPIGDLPGQAITAETGSPASNGGAPDVVTGPTQPVVVMSPTDPVVSDVVSGGPSDDEEFASTPTADDDAVEVPAPPVAGRHGGDPRRRRRGRAGAARTEHGPGDRPGGSRCVRCGGVRERATARRRR